MTREQMIENVICKRGFEDELTITFCEIAETWLSDDAVKNMYDIAMNTMIGE